MLSALVAKSTSKTKVSQWEFPLIAVNIYMEWLEEAIHTAPIDCKPRLWKRYVDGVFEIVKKGSTQQLT